MKPLLVDRPPCAEPALVAPGTTLPALLVALVARMTAEQRDAFRAKMAAMDLQKGAFSHASFTLGRA